MNDKKVILVVDDQAENLTLLRSLLEKYFDVRIAKSGNMALTLLHNNHVDLILLDIEMPNMNGFEFMKNFHLQCPEKKNTPVVFVTSHASSDMVSKAINEGGKGYIVKPIKEEILFQKIDSLIGMPAPKEVITPLEQHLLSLLASVSQGDSKRAETLSKQLEAYAPDEGSMNRRYIDGIVKMIQTFEYEKGIKKINDFLHNLSLLKT